MSELADNFNTLPNDYQDVLRLAQDKLGINVTPLQELKGGRTGARLYLVSVSSKSGSVQHLVLKLDHKSKKSKMDELERHTIARSQAPPEFARDHIATLAFDRVELDESLAIFYSIAGQSLHHFRPLANYQQQRRLEKLFNATNEVLLKVWNASPAFEQAIHPQKLLTRWLGYRLSPGGNIEKFLKDICHIHSDTPGFLIQGHVFPNPLFYARESDRWGAIRPIDAIVGFQHGDLNIGNILARFTGHESEMTGYYLIDFALFKVQMPLFFDQRYLELSYLIRELSRTPFIKWVDFVTRFADNDIIDPQEVPIELTGACAVIRAGRKAFSDWVQANYPSLSDDLWGQFWLAAVAAGLNFCNKAGLSDRERLASLIFAATHMKHYHTTFGVPLPVEVSLLFDINEWDEIKTHPDLPANFPPLKSLNSFNNNLPIQLTSFIGRKTDLEAVKDLLMRTDVHLVTLTGPGGMGKTRLSLQAAADLIDRFNDGVYFIDLAPIQESESVLAAIAQTIGLRETSDRSLLDELKVQLRSKNLLLLLDNFEQVTEAGPQVTELLRSCPQSKMLVTSREALHIRGEHVFRIPPLTVPGADIKKHSVKKLLQFEAIRLFIERSIAVKPDFELTNDNAPVVAEICSRLDGLPLAIELAAARTKLFSPQALLDRMGSRLKMLRGGARDLPVRQQTLRDTIDWSYELLNTDEQRLFALLSVFPNCTFEAVEAVVSGIEQLEDTNVDVLDGLSSLTDKSLIRQMDQGTGGTRFFMLETIREYATEKLDADPEFSASTRRVHANFFADFTQNQWGGLTGSKRETALVEMGTELENLRTAWRYWVIDGDLGQLRKLTDCLWLLYDARGWYHSMIDLTTDLLSVLASKPTTPESAQQEIMLQTSLARALMTVNGCTPEVEQAYTRALELCEKQGEIPQLFPVLRGLSTFYIYIADFEKGARIGEQILSLAERQDNTGMRVDGHLVLGYNLAFLGDIHSGLDHLKKGIAHCDPGQSRSHRFRLGNDPGVSCFTTSAMFLWMVGFPDRALEMAKEAGAIASQLNHPFSRAYALFHTGLLHLWRREIELARESMQAALKIAEEHEFQIWKAVATCLHGAALAGLGQTEKGLSQTNRGMDLYQEMKTPPVFWPMLLSIQAGVYGLAGRPAEGLAQIDRALEIVRPDSRNPLSSELCRLKGELLLLISRENMNEAEPLFLQALEIGQEQKAAMLELRAATSLSRLWKIQGKKKQPHQMLSTAYGKMTEGFSLADLTEAKALLEE